MKQESYQCFICIPGCRIHFKLIFFLHLFIHFCQTPRFVLTHPLFTHFAPVSHDTQFLGHFFLCYSLTIFSILKHDTHEESDEKTDTQAHLPAFLTQLVWAWGWAELGAKSYSRLSPRYPFLNPFVIPRIAEILIQYVT